MHLSGTIITLSSFAATAFALCSTGIYTECKWFGGEAGDRMCGHTDYHLGAVVDGLVLVEWSRDGPPKKICTELGNTLSPACCLDYGTDCKSGYKRLWCRQPPIIAIP
jgi:hypothetical protein